MRLMPIFLLSILNISLCNGAGCQFPSTIICSSLDKRWELRCKSSKDVDGGYLNILILHAQETSKEFEIYRFDRSCDALWSKDSRYLALTDWLGSNVSEIFIVAIIPPFRAKAISEVVGNTGPFLSKEEREGHIYYEALQWLDNSKLRIRAFGHTDVPPYNEFEHQFICDIVRGNSVLVK
jgi:hypothetical protein